MYEFPLPAWEDMSGSNRKPRDYLAAALDLAVIWFRYMRRGARPALGDRQPAVANPAAFTPSMATTTTARGVELRSVT